MKRVASVDIFRAVTMLLMVFVNDLWSLHDIPRWLEHADAGEDGMGLSDVVFPAFLFIVGLSIPFATQARISKGETQLLIALHIVRRTIALLVMGFFMVNHEHFREDIPDFTRNAWQVVMVIAFILIWNNYEKKNVLGKVPVWLLQALGILLLLALAVVYKGGTPDDPRWMYPHWWGILGLIGWAYLFCSLLFLLAGQRTVIIIFILLILHALNVQEFFPVTGDRGITIAVSASNHALVMSGVLAAIIYIRYKDDSRRFLFPALLLIPALISLAYGFATRPWWGISKIMATPSWTAICAGISFIFFLLIYILADVFHHTRWAGVIMPAGRSALTCYLLPGIVYPLFWPLIEKLPDPLTGGIAGIIKSLLFAFAIVLLTGLLERIKIKLKI